MEAERGGEEEIDKCLITLSLQRCTPPFDLEKAICSHGLFMMAPNLWLPSSNTLLRPLRLPHSSNTTIIVRITHHHPSSSLHIWVLGLAASSLSLQDRRAIEAQVARMLRLSEDEDEKIIAFHKIHKGAKDSGFCRIFRSPTLFEDMVKCILLCNTGWGRTLSMAKSLCELQFELKGAPIGWSNAEAAYHNEAYLEVDGISDTADGSLTLDPHLPRQRISETKFQIGNFPSPEELVNLDERFLAERCGVGYRAKRILELATRVVEQRLLQVLEDGEKITDYDGLTQKLLAIKGVGTFTSVNVLMCMGFYHKIPADSETIWHLKQFHSKNRCKASNVEECAEQVYDMYAPFQFLAYWYEVWASYEKRFGKLSKMNYFSYRSITGNNMRDKPLKGKRITKKIRNKQ